MPGRDVVLNSCNSRSILCSLQNFLLILAVVVVSSYGGTTCFLLLVA